MASSIRLPQRALILIPGKPLQANPILRKLTSLPTRANVLLASDIAKYLEPKELANERIDGGRQGLRLAPIEGAGAR